MTSFDGVSRLSLWAKVKAGDALSLADIPELIPYRWGYFRDSWPTIRQYLSNRNDTSAFREALDDLERFIAQQREQKSVNPFLGSGVLYRFYPVFSSILIEQIGLSNEERDILRRKRKEVELFSKSDFLKIKQDIIAHRDLIADNIGLSSSVYNQVYNRGEVKGDTLLKATAADINLMKVLQDQISSIDYILANNFKENTPSIDPFALARLNANNPDVEIGQYSSGFLVRLNHGEDLQGLATRYLGNPNKWIDIAIANGLRAPYIDEVGEQVFLISNGKGNQVNINGDVKLHVNQLLFIQSDTIPFPSQRHVVSVREIPTSGEVVVTLSGEANLDEYLLADNANIRVFKPNTVNSSQFVLIPSATPLPGQQNETTPWFLVGSPAEEKRAGIDIALDEKSGDLQFTSNGDISLSYGIANAIQAIRLKLSTELGSNRLHPTYGLVNLVGSRNINEANVKTALVESITSQIGADSRFDRVESINVVRVPTANAVAFSIDLVVKMSGAKGTLIPISFTTVL